MNIREFASMCGISIAAASRILNKPLDQAMASQETYDRIHKKAVELGYRPNYAARVLHTKHSNCIGVVVGYPSVFNSRAILHGISEYVCQYKIALNITTCNNDPRREMQAFQDMLYRGVDAIIWHPIYQCRDLYHTGHIERALHRAMKSVPIVCLGYNNTPGIFKICANWEATATAAALRQLKLGCRKFMIIKEYYHCPPVSICAEAYRRTLLNHGVSPHAISEIVVNTPNGTPDWRVMNDVDGIWIYHLFLLHGIINQMKNVCNTINLHVDGMSFSEDYAILSYIYGHDHFDKRFASLQRYSLNATTIARRGAEMALEAIHNPGLPPYDYEFCWQRENQHPAPLRVLFNL